MDGFDLIIAAVLLQFAMLLALILYAILVRIRHALRSRYRNKFRNIWNYLIPAYLSGDIDRMHIYFSLKSRDFPLFGEFVRPYLLDIKGDIHLKLASLLNYLGFHIYLKKLLGDRNPLRRAYAVHFLGLMQDPDTIALTRSALSDRSELVLYQAAEALMRLQDIESMPKVLQRVSDVSRQNQERVAIYLFEFGPKILPDLQPMLRDETLKPWIRVYILKVLEYYRYVPATWEILELYLHTTDREVRIACVKALAAIGEPTLVGFFEEMLSDADPVVCAEAAKAIGALGTARHTWMLVKLLRRDDYWVLKHTVGALTRLDMLPVLLLHRKYRQISVSGKAIEVIREELAEYSLRKHRGSNDVG